MQHEPTQRNSLAELGAHGYAFFKTIYRSPTLKVVFSALIAAFGGFTAYNGGWDAGLKTKFDPKMAEKRLAAANAKISELETSLGEALVDVNELRESIGETREDFNEANAIAHKHRIEFWLAVVLTNAPAKKVKAYELTFTNHIGQGLDAKVAAYMTLGWGSVGR